MKKVVFLICIPAFLALITFQRVEGCSCLRDSLMNLYKKSDFVFIGNLVNKTVENTIDGEPDPNADTNYVVEVYKIYKNGNLLSGTVDIKTHGTASLCGIDLDIDKEYVFNGMGTMSTEGDPTLTIGACNMMLHSPITQQMIQFVQDSLDALQFIETNFVRTL
ncbi:uncharacterized protein LOC128185890 [Crassostrea angulata]|uniref:uncharacterized protein LOC128185890 n=1 Tax=Magallana angulata TaxID=2784310 RepID=UPI0022B118BD|nr:uncharacterized protein LOC128185890 [Crassostrea angulata]